jgi:lipoate-protein ligase A
VSHENNDLRLLVDPASDGVTNMARDEALLDSVGRGHSPPTLRFYSWDPPTISLGYFQKYAEYEALPPPAGELAVVRRTTGGGAILHDKELTYSVSLPLSHGLLRGGAVKLYARMHEAMIAALGPATTAVLRGSIVNEQAQRGPFFCFSREHADDVVIGRDKLAGSAQRRTRTAVLQHGSLILERRFEQQACASAGAAASDIDALMSRICRALESAETVRVERGSWTEAELKLGDEYRGKYADLAWTRRC